MKPILLNMETVPVHLFQENIPEDISQSKESKMVYLELDCLENNIINNKNHTYYLGFGV